jgi:apolipoprotein N-acyltransferase
MKAEKLSLPGKGFSEKPVLFLVSTALITLTVSFPLLSPLLLAVFPAVFKLIEGEKIIKQIILLFSLVFTFCLILFSNVFFIQCQFLLFLLASFYFIVLLGSDLFIAFYTVNHKYAPLLIFVYAAVSRLVLSFSTVVFPFYWTLTMHLLPFMGAVSQFTVPLLWETFCVTCAAMLYSPCSRKPARYLLIQLAAVAVAVVVFSGIVRAGLGRPAFRPGMECVLVQGGYSRHDYVLIERHPDFGIRMAQKYLGHTEEVTNGRFLVLPESAFPLRQIEDSEIMQKMKSLARQRNRYIMTGILLEEGGKVYNASALIDPEGRLQNVYRKRNPVLFVETSTFTPGITANTFTVDGHTIAPVICYESLFIRNYFRDKRPGLYIVISNDIFSDKTILSYLHIAYGVINARTLGTPLLQAMQNGPSVYLDSQGRLTFLTKPYEQAIGLQVKIK